IDELKIDGITALTLTWNGENFLGGGAFSDAPLTDLGVSVIKRLNKNKMACDLSHINRKGFYKAIEIADYPFASHSCCNSVFLHKRNLYDEQLKLIAEKNGVIGICFYPAFLGGENVFQKIYENIYNMLSLDLENNISIGSDFDGADMSGELKDVSYVPKLYKYLSQRGINKNILSKIFYKNADNFFTNL
ncbi:MAG: dipeptidase, partial [Clostridia bacterium]|nr:dipeptidase [Clostridia bacterium]